ncbi:ECA1 gametogenesis related family protein [Arabidopsis thaliana]|uniref:ECA1 gametogenesis related family protein n=1 Tax=Arabidopsis thaliana TaxID=3702 RepID=A8MQY6_ARATH|nr:ECA1 gametogenesis related family protein [Arabidopsis thaliana]AED94069.1 ECA1 gametogenesis related family protein [Arabidopsis thaliana]|eukprot:NP_001078642.1 ECA1 gametogenesis related family protein [Arabidopsis thaliana]
MSIKNVFSLLAVLCIIVSVNAQLSQFPAQLPFPFPFQLIPGLPDITKCFSSVMDIPGYIAEISQSIFTGKFDNLGPACCKAFLDADNCIPKISFISFFPPMLKEQCSRVAGATPPIPK